MTILQFITLTITLGLAAFGLTNAAKLGWSECRFRYWKNRAERMTRENIDWQERAENEDWQQILEDANKWRASRAARLKRDANRTQVQRQTIRFTMRQIQRGEP